MLKSGTALMRLARWASVTCSLGGVRARVSARSLGEIGAESATGHRREPGDDIVSGSRQTCG